jgi:hypothetical protein
MNTVRRTSSLYFFWVKCKIFVKTTVLLGIACWSASRQLSLEQMRSDWNAVRVDIMYRCFSLHVRVLQHDEFLWQLHTALIYLP